MGDRIEPRQAGSSEGERDRGVLSADGRRWLWVVLVVAASVVSSLALACATPFAALATLAAVTMGRRDGAGLIVAAWLADQVVGYAVLGYPRTADSYAWGVALGAASLLALGAARTVAAPLRGSRAAGVAAAFPAAFAVFEAAIWGGTRLLGSGAGAMAPGIVLRILAINLVALIALIALYRVALLVGLVAERGAGARPVAAAS